MDQEKFDALYPLLPTQGSLLFHSLSSENDQGFLHIQGRLKGNLDMDRFQDALNKTFAQHEMLRASFHWKDLKKPVIVINKRAPVRASLEDLTSLDQTAAMNKIEGYLSSDRVQSFELSKAPLSRFMIFKLADNRYHLVWSCHHLVIDGWSTGIFFADLLHSYEGGLGKSAPKHAQLYRYLKKQDKRVSREYWANKLAGLGLNDNPVLGQGKVATSLSEEKIRFDSITSEGISAFLKSNRVTLNSLIKGVWALLICKLKASNEALFMSVNSGRRSTFPGIESMVGMFMTVMPNRLRFNEDLTLSEWIDYVHQDDIAQAKYENLSLEEIQSCLSMSKSLRLFDTLLIIENYPMDNLKSESLEIHEVRSEITTTYPLTLVVIPGKELQLILKLDEQSISPHLLEWVKEGLVQVLSNLSSNDQTVGSLIDSPNLAQETDSELVEDRPTEITDLPSDSSVASRIVKVWEDVLNVKSSGVEDDFFALGGKSLQAAELINRLNDEFGESLAVTSLLQYPTIKLLTERMLKNEPRESSSNGAEKAAIAPLFCFPPGGASINFFAKMAGYLGNEFPIHPILPLKPEDLGKNLTLEEIASVCLKEMRSVQPTGPYKLLGFCLSPALCVELSHQLRQKGEEVEILIAIDPTPFFDPVKHTLGPNRSQRLQRFLNIIKHVDFNEIKSSLLNRAELFRRKLHRTLGEQESRDFRQLELQLVHAIETYDWKNYSGRIAIIKTTTVNRYIETYGLEGVIDQEAQIYQLDFPHSELMVEPFIQELSSRIRKILRETTQRE